MLAFNHIHLKSVELGKSAAWYVEKLGAEIVRETATSVALDLAGVRVSISGPPPGESLPRGSADPHLGLEHYAFQTDDLDALLARDLELLEPVRNLESGLKIAFIRAPDDVRIELMQPPS